MRGDLRLAEQNKSTQKETIANYTQLRKMSNPFSSTFLSNVKLLFILLIKKS